LFARRLTSKLDLVGELTSVLVFTSLASTLFCFSTVIALAERSLVAGLPRWPARLVATAEEDRLSFPTLKPALFQIENDDDRD